MTRLLLLLFVLLTVLGCRQDISKESDTDIKGRNEVRFASGFSIMTYNDYSLLTVSQPWPNAEKTFAYVLKRKNAVVPDSLRDFPSVVVPINKIIVTSTTHIPSLEMLGVEQTLVGFPNLKYMSSEKILARAAAGKIRELGSNQSLNTEVVIDLDPDVLIGYGIDNHNPVLDNLQNAGIKVMLNGDWNEQNPLGKAEWIKLFGVLYDREKQADSVFNAVVSGYEKATALARSAKQKPVVLMGGLFENKWNVASGDSWGARFIKDANGQYPWADTKGTGSQSLPFEAVLEKAGNADVWIAPGQFATLAEVLESNPHYGQFKAFRNKNVYTFKVGKNGGILYYELAPNRPDLVLQDVIKMLHPELLPNHKLVFFEKMK